MGGRTRRFNCFAYGFGVWEHPDFIREVDDAGNSAIINSKIVQEMIDDGTLKAVAATVVSEGLCLPSLRVCRCKK
jgi:hypothetical protein